MTEVNREAEPHAALITELEAARALGVAHGTLKAARLHRLEANPLRDLPHVKIGRSVRYRRADIVDWIERHIHNPAHHREGAAERGAA
jgi:hypothetical protein